MEGLLVSTGFVALAEMGDKTQLLSFLLAARYRRPWPICAGILLATAANHALAGAVGAWVADLAGAAALRWILGLSFLSMAAWILVPDRLDAPLGAATGHGVLATTTIAFFLAEMGDKTQIATVALAARYDAFVAVVCGTTLGMMLANVPAVMLGEKFAHRIPMRAARGVAAATFAALGGAVLLGFG